jgi:hypothetical protein
MLCGCAATSVKKTWKSPEYKGGSMGKAAVLAVDERMPVRKSFENRLAYQLQQAGASAFVSYDRLSLEEINRDKPAAAQRLRSDGATVVVIMRLTDRSTAYRESRPGAERYAGITTGYEPGAWYDYYSVAYMDMGVTYGTLKQKVYLETSIFDLQTTKRIWSALTETSISEGMDDISEMDRIVSKVIAAMRKDGMFP